MEFKTRRFLSAVGVLAGLGVMVYYLSRGPLWLFSIGLVLAIASMRLVFVKLICPACRHVHLDGTGTVGHCSVCGTELEPAPPAPRRWIGRVGWWGLGLAIIPASWAMEHGYGFWALIVLLVGVLMPFVALRRLVCGECGTKMLSFGTVSGHCQVCGAAYGEPPPDS